MCLTTGGTHNEVGLGREREEEKRRGRSKKKERWENEKKVGEKRGKVGRIRESGLGG